MADQNWDYLLLKNGDKAYFTPPPPTSTVRGGILAEPATTADTQPVRIGEDGFLYTSIIRSSITVEVKTQDNVVVSGVTVVARENDANGDEIASAQYSGQPVTLDVPRNIHYYIEVVGTLADHFGPNTVSGVASSPSISHIITYQDASNITTYKGVVEAVRLGLNDTLIGKEIADTWTDEDGVAWDDPSIVVHVGNVTDPEGSIHVAAIMQRKYASVRAMSFDSTERETPTETHAKANVYYYGKAYFSGSTSWYYTWQNISTGSSLSSLTDPVYNDIKDTSTTSNLAQFGWNNWQYSNIRQYLNSNATAGNWWQSSHLGDSVNSYDKRYAGWLKGITKDLQEIIKPIQITSYGYINDTTEKTSFITVDTVFLPSAFNMMGSTNAVGKQWDYWKQVVGKINNSSCSARIFSRDGNKAVILRDSDSSSTNGAYIHMFGTDGAPTTTACCNSRYFTPCFAIY